MKKYLTRSLLLTACIMAFIQCKKIQQETKKTLALSEIVIDEIGYKVKSVALEAATAGSINRTGLRVVAAPGGFTTQSRNIYTGVARVRLRYVDRNKQNNTAKKISPMKNPPLSRNTYAEEDLESMKALQTKTEY